MKYSAPSSFPPYRRIMSFQVNKSLTRPPSSRSSFDDQHYYYWKEEISLIFPVRQMICKLSPPAHPPLFPTIDAHSTAGRPADVSFMTQFRVVRPPPPLPLFRLLHVIR